MSMTLMDTVYRHHPEHDMRVEIIVCLIAGDAKWDPPDGAALFTAYETAGEDGAGNGKVGSASRDNCPPNRSGKQKELQTGGYAFYDF